VIAVTDAAGNVVERYAYTDYGCPTITDGAGVPLPPNDRGTARSAIGNSYLFTGRQWDEESGLYFYRARFYDCEGGRFLSTDPLGILTSLSNIPEIDYLFLQYTSAGRLYPVLRRDLTQPLYMVPDANQRPNDVSSSSMVLQGLYVYAAASPHRYVDPLGLKPSKADGEAAIAAAAAQLKSLCKEPCCQCDKQTGNWTPCTPTKCKADAQTVVDAIKGTWSTNYGKGKCTGRDPIGGYLCWDWSGAFEKAGQGVKSPCWTIVEAAVQKKNSRVVHFFVKLHACNNTSDACTRMIDDGWFDLDFVHAPPWPPAANWTPTNWRPPQSRWCKPHIRG